MRFLKKPLKMTDMSWLHLIIVTAGTTARVLYIAGLP